MKVLSPLALQTIFLLLSSIGFTSASSAQQQHWHDISYIEQSFYEIALQNEYSIEQSALRKWAEPLAIYIDHQVGDDELHMQLLTMHLDHLQSITQLPFRYVDSRDEANLVIYITRSSEVNEIISTEISPDSVTPLRSAVCLANIRVNSNSEITQALVVIPVDRARLRGKLVSCFVEELTQILGLPNDSETIYPTIFSDRSIYKLLTGLDYLLLKLLYLPEVKAGMSQNMLKPILQQQLRQWQQDGTIEQAQAEVIKGELYLLLGYRK